MKKRSRNAVSVLILILFLIDAYNSDSSWSVTGKVIQAFNSGDDLKIASWNLQIFGVNKASNEELMKSYADKIDDYDIIFVQEIRDSSDTAFNKLCSLLPGYNCKISSRAGRTNSKEQYGIIYKNFSVNYIKDFNPDKEDRWERPPIEVNFNLGSYNLSIFNIHVKPSGVKKELDFLDDVAQNNGFNAVIGDLNADCDYYDHSKETEFNNWDWVIKDNEDTTSGSSNCAYDRIILSDQLKSKLIKYGIDKNVKKEQSDHYLVWFEVNF